MPKLSVIIPVHNGAKKLPRSVKSILDQSFKDYELILVENGSTDSSWQVCQMLQRKDERIIITQSELSTSFARKKGIEIAEGEYITFCDCDDLYYDRKSLARMVDIADQTKSDIIQFGYYINRFGKLTRYVTSEQMTIDRVALLDRYIAGAIGSYKDAINLAVWNKMYKNNPVKLAAEKMDKPLIKTEDGYLNTYTFFEDSVKSVTFSSQCFYVYYTGIGFSGTADAGQKLFEEYRITKPIALALARKHQCGKTVFIKCYREILNFLHSLIIQCIISGKSEKEVIDIIREYTSWSFVKEASDYFLNDDYAWDDHILRLSQIENAEMYYHMCLSDITDLPMKRIQYQAKWSVKNTLRWIDKLL